MFSNSTNLGTISVNNKLCSSSLVETEGACESKNLEEAVYFLSEEKDE